MRILIYISENDDISVKSVLKNHFKMTSSLITALKNTGGISVNGNCVTVRKLLNAGDELKLIIPEANSDNIVPVDGKLDILYEDEDILCVNKPSDMPTHPSQNHHKDTLANIVCSYYKDTPFTFRVSNRLDRYTSGVVIIAKNMYSASFLCTEDFKKSMKKTYYAVCRGHFNKKEDKIISPIARDEGSTVKRRVSPDGRYAETDYEIVSYKCNCSLVKVKPKTGRTHQIRVHMANINHPLVNDFLYDESIDNTKNFMLHCASIEFTHPISGERLTVEAPLPDIYRKYFNEST